MNNYKIVNNKVHFPILACFLSLCLIIGRDTLIANVSLGFYPSQIITILLVGILGILFAITNFQSLRDILKDHRLWIIWIGSIIYLLPMFVKQDFQLMYASILFCLIFGVFISFISSIEQTGKVFVFIIGALSLYSFLSLYVLNPLAVNGVLPANQVTNSAGVTLNHFGLAYAIPQTHYIRNFSIFREPGVFSFFINLAFYLNNEIVTYSKKYVYYVLNAILVLASISTFSTSGIAVTCALCLFFVLDKKLYKAKYFWGIAGGIAAVATLFIIVVIIKKGTLYWELLSMVNKLFTKNESIFARVTSLVENIKLIATHFFFGDTVWNVFYSFGNNTSSTLILLSMCGVFGGLANIVLWISFLWKKNRHILLNIFLILVMFLSFNTQNLTTNLFFWLFPLMSYCNKIANQR